MSQSVERMQLGHIMPYHREIARRLILGQRQVDIANAIGLTQGRLSIICNSPLFKMELQKLADLRDAGVGDIGKTLQEVSPIALEVIERTMLMSRSDAIRLRAAETILDRAGYGAIQKSLVNVKKSISYENMTGNELRQLVKERVERIDQESQVKQIMEDRTKDIEISFDETPSPSKFLNDCSNSEQPLPSSSIYESFI